MGLSGSLFLAATACLVVTAWVGFTLAEFGMDQPRLVLLLGTIALVGSCCLVFRSVRGRIQFSTLAGLSLPLAIAMFLYSPPDEWIFGGLDPGSYVNAGAAIAKSGRIVQVSPTLASLSPSVRSALFPTPASRLPGMYLMFLRSDGIQSPHFTASADQVVPHGFHLFPTTLAFGYAVAGVRSELLVNPILALLGLVGFYLLIRRLFGTSVAFLATLLFAVNPAEVWFASYPDAEIFAQFLLFSGLLAFVIMLDTSNRWLALLAGFLLAAVHLDKIELALLPFVILLYFGYRSLTGKFDPTWYWFLGSYAVILLQAVLHAALIATWYTVRTLQAILSA
ncbi:MAG TPA: glycosyltransferase family 39 protein, partial [Chloroflexota bacterium]|nr:glycosyltransferase family 39 protein [Chloroflexota bacterium]